MLPFVVLKNDTPVYVFAHFVCVYIYIYIHRNSWDYLGYWDAEERGAEGLGGRTTQIFII